MNIEEAAAAFGQPVRHIEEVARGPRYKNRERQPVPSSFEVRHRELEEDLDGTRLTVRRRELWGDGQLVWAIEHSRPA